MKRKVLSILLCASMTAALLAGCGVSTSTSDVPAASTAQAASEAAPASSEAAAATDTAASGDAEEISWMFWDDLEATDDLMSQGYASSMLLLQPAQHLTVTSAIRDLILLSTLKPEQQQTLQTS